MQVGSSQSVIMQPVTVRHLGSRRFEDAHQQMLNLQGQLADARSAAVETLLLFEPSAVITLGSKSSDGDLLVDEETLKTRGVTIQSVDRGGEATYHGPGQLIAYPVLRLRPQERDLHRLLRALESAIVTTLDQWGIESRTDSDHTGVWVQHRKIACIGMSVRRWVTGHGSALCISGDLSPFRWIVPCGIHDCPFTSMEQELGTAPRFDEVETVLAANLLEVFNRMASS